jgi:pimeloyl-ACP methyl ester carboxylesterase
MEREAREILPAILKHFDIERPLLVGHSDGASIALIYAGLLNFSDPEAIIAMAPHVFCEDTSIEGIKAAKYSYEYRDLRKKLEKFHGNNTECAFRGWNDAWLDPAFRGWNVERFLPQIKVPLLAIQGREDSFGTLKQIEVIKKAVSGSYRELILTGCDHNPWREQQERVLENSKEFIFSLR